MARREERTKKGVERRERGSVTSSAREAIDCNRLVGQEGLPHSPVYLCNRKLFGVKVRRLQTCDYAVAALIDDEARPPCLNLARSS